MTRSVAPLLLLAGILSPFGGVAHRKAEEGNQRYLDGAYEDALRAYTEAQVASPEAPELHYDIGNVLYRQGDFQGAEEAFTRSLLSADPRLAPDASYNLGNALFRGQQFDDAVKAYRRTLERRPDDADAKRNLELALRALHQQQQQEKQQSQQDRKEPQQQQQEGGAGAPDQKQPKESPPDQKKEARPDEEKQGKMSPEEAERLLERLGEEERRNLERRAARRAAGEAKLPTKDW